MFVKMEKSCRYADPSGPHLPQIDFVEGAVVDVCDELGKSIVSNEHGVVVGETHETPSVQPESKDTGLEVESKDAESSTGAFSEAYDNLSPKKQRFVDEYIIGFDGTQAAIRAGYSENAAVTRGAALLENEDIAAAIAERSE